MKTNRKFGLLSLIVVFILVLTACSAPGKVINKYDELIATYQAAQRQTSSFGLCTDTKYASLQLNNSQNIRYMQADIDKMKAYRDADAKLAQLMSNYKDANGNTIPPEKLDLKQLADSGALPAGMVPAFQQYIKVLSEAPVAAMSEKVQIALMDSNNEAFASIQLCGEDMNEAIQKYNTVRNQVSGDIVAQAAKALNVKDLPQQLPYYQGGASGPVKNPVAPSGNGQ